MCICLKLRCIRYLFWFYLFLYLKQRVNFSQPFYASPIVITSASHRMNPKNVNTVITEWLEVSYSYSYSYSYSEKTSRKSRYRQNPRKHSIIEIRTLYGRISWLIWFELDFVFLADYIFCNYKHNSRLRSFLDIFKVWNTPLGVWFPSSKFINKFQKIVWILASSDYIKF